MRCTVNSYLNFTVYAFYHHFFLLKLFFKLCLIFMCVFVCIFLQRGALLLFTLWLVYCIYYCNFKLNDKLIFFCIHTEEISSILLYLIFVFVVFYMFGYCSNRLQAQVQLRGFVVLRSVDIFFSLFILEFYEKNWFIDVVVVAYIFIHLCPQHVRRCLTC